MVGFGNEKLSVRKSIPRLSRFEESLVPGVLLRTTHLDAIQVPLMVHSLDINKRKEKGEDLIPSFFLFSSKKLKSCLDHILKRRMLFSRLFRHYKKRFRSPWWNHYCLHISRLQNMTSSG